ncbi:PilN domain-containing protein [Methylophilus sp.]|uniref:PilN domain-containing protein n=1 Tax=Methylophilus sp. TaxID=29541 RepID=UPI000D46889A|nr:PilN domain-containing protein [Methylophilus sp.]PPD12071.1 MAG: hypothetical protein CTY26_06800 [Methylophilus sp.]
MSQQINLFNPALIRPRDWLTLKNVVLIYLVSLAVMYGLYNQSQSELAELTTERESAQAALDATMVELSVEKNRTSQSANNQEDEKVLKALIETRDMQSRMLTTLKLIQNESGQHILDYMQGFAENVMKGVWLTGFKLNHFEQQLSIMGQSLTPELVPAYVEKLGQHVAFHGRLFSGLVLKEMQLSATESKPVVATPTGASVAQPSSEKMAASAGAGQPSPMHIVSFEFKGEKQSAGNDHAANAVAPVDEGAKK